MGNKLNKILKILFLIEFVLIALIVALFFVDNQEIPTAFAIKENSSIEKTNFKTFTKAVCEEKSEHIICQDKLFIKCNGKEYLVNDDNLHNFTACNLKLNLSDIKVTGSAIFRKESVDDENYNKILIDNGAGLIKINVEIADDNEERIKGLMFREKLNENEGMFFIFEDESHQTFWMKNTLIPLDIIFIDKNFKIVDIKNAIPCKEEPCVLYKSSKPAKYVLEVNENFSTKNNISIGNKVGLNKQI